MDTALLVARMLLAAVFLVAGLAKLADRAGSRQAIQEFGLPAFLARPLGTLLPLVELTIALALIPTISAWWGAIGACALLLLFVAGIGLNLIRDGPPIATVSVNSIPLRWAGSRSPAMESWLWSPASSFGKGRPMLA